MPENNVSLDSQITCRMKKKYKRKPNKTILFLDGSKLINETIIVEAQARYGEDWCIYKTEYSSFSFN
jgi:hypothetical protein